MTMVEVEVSCPVHDSFRVQQVTGLFDVPIARRASERFRVEVPELGDDWQIGLIVGPSGSGKSTLADRLFGDRLYRQPSWPEDRAVVDCLGDLPIKQITALFTAVGFSSPPSWIKPYRVLSGGERFRCDLARAMAGASLKATTDGPEPLVAFDEFTSVVDRTVARIGSAAIAKAIRSGRIRCRLAAVTCHYDVAEWLQPDWVLDMATGTFTRRCLRRPEIRVDVFRCEHAAWSLFKRHHYLNGSLHGSARCYIALWEGTPVAFCATVAMMGRKGRRRISRIVTLPDFQGIGIGMRVAETVARLHVEEGYRVNVTASHPAMIAHCRRSPHWRAVNIMKNGAARQGSKRLQRYRGSRGRAVVSFEYTGAS